MEYLFLTENPYRVRPQSKFMLKALSMFDNLKENLRCDVVSN